MLLGLNSLALALAQNTYELTSRSTMGICAFLNALLAYRPAVWGV